MSRKYRVEQKFTTGWGLVSETSFKLSKDEAIQIYKDGNYKDCNYNLDEYFYEYEFNSIREEKE